jgi:hypothetical protein
VTQPLTQSSSSSPAVADKDDGKTQAATEKDPNRGAGSGVELGLPTKDLFEIPDDLLG